MNPTKKVKKNVDFTKKYQDFNLWKFQDFPVTQILREINFKEARNL